MRERVVSLAVVVLFIGTFGWGAGDFAPGDTVPGYAHRNGSGSMVDIRANGTHDGSGWTVVFRRALRTGDAQHDIQFAAGGTYYFQVATWNNSGDEAHNASEMNTVYSMAVPSAPGPVAFSATPGLFTSLSGELLASDEVTITVSWSDATRNDLRKQWQFNGSSWSQSSDNEDRVVFIWDLQADQFVTAGKCLAMCHPPVGMYTAPGSRVDTWHWKATRSNPSGYADDQYWDDGAGGTTSGRRNDKGQTAYSDNLSEGLPKMMASHDPGASARYIFEFQEGMAAAAPWANGAWAAGAYLPGYVGRRGSGSRVDTRAVASHATAGWTVTIRRKLDTGDPAHDIVFAPGGTYYFQVATWNNSGDEAHNVSEMTNVYSMTIPAAPGPLTFSATPGLFTALSGELLSSDEVAVTVSWPDTTRNDVRRQWTFNGSSWSQSTENEDRVAFIWDMQNNQFATAGTCATMCHTPTGMYTAPGTFVDAWHWKAARTANTDFCDDQWWDDGAGGTTGGRRDDPGTSVYKDNAASGGAPSFMAKAGSSESARFLFDHAPAAGWDRAIPFASGSAACAGGSHYWTEIAAHLAGKLGSQWRTDVVLKNTAASSAAVTFTLHTLSGEHESTDTIDPSAQGVFEDLVGTMGVTDKGALEICSSQPLTVISRIYSQTANGTFGQFVDGYAAGGGLAQGQSALLPGLRQKTGEFRTNISVTNTGLNAAQVEIALSRTDASLLHTYTLTVDPGTVVQDLEPFRVRAGQPNLGWGFATVKVLTGSGILSSASVIDSKTNDPTTIPMKP